MIARPVRDFIIADYFPFFFKDYALPRVERTSESNRSISRVFSAPKLYITMVVAILFYYAVTPMFAYRE